VTTRVLVATAVIVAARNTQVNAARISQSLHIGLYRDARHE
jgi:hypothetical protein